MKAAAGVGSVFLFWVLSNSAAAGCVRANGVTGPTIASVDFGTVYVDAQAPAGTELAKVDGVYSGGNFICDTVYDFGGDLNLFQVPFAPPVYKTNINGIGISLRSSYKDYPFRISNPAGGYGLNGFVTQVRLIKTVSGPISEPANLQGGTLVNFYAGDLLIANMNLLPGTRIVPRNPTCTIRNQAISVSLSRGNPVLTGYSGVIGKRIPFRIHYNCSNTAKIKVSINGPEYPTSISGYSAGLLALDPGSSASGVAVLLSTENYSTMNLGETFIKTYDPNSLIDDYFEFTAQYVVSSTASPGVANASATFTLTYE